jgi:hypothetical protein
MSDYNLSLDYHLSQLQQVAADLRAERMLAAPSSRRPLSRIRTAIGVALTQVGASLVASQAQPSAQAR